MIKAQLITGGNSQTRYQKIVDLLKNQQFYLNLPHPDLILIEGLNSIGIDQIRELKAKLSLKPYQKPVKIAVIPESEKLTVPAQNSFLKILEEPPNNSLIIMSAPTPDMLIPTVVSRCWQIKLPNQEQIKLTKTQLEEFKKLLITITEKSVGQRLQTAQNYALSKEQALEATAKITLVSRIMLKVKPSLTTAKNLKMLAQTRLFLQANVNPRLAIGNLFLLLS